MQIIDLNNGSCIVQNELLEELVALIKESRKSNKNLLTVKDAFNEYGNGFTGANAFDNFKNWLTSIDVQYEGTQKRKFFTRDGIERAIIQSSKRG